MNGENEGDKTSGGDLIEGFFSSAGRIVRINPIISMFNTTMAAATATKTG